MAITLQGVCTLLSVFDMPEAVRFYCELLGFSVASRSPTYAVEEGVEQFHWCMLTQGDTTLMLNTAYDEGQRPPQRPRRQHDPFGMWLYFGCRDLEGAYTLLQAAGIPCEAPRLVSYGFRVLSLRDPDGYGITLQWPAE